MPAGVVAAAAAVGRRSAGVLVFRQEKRELEVLLGHMGGPLWARRDNGAWTVPKGEFSEDEEPLAAAQREFVEELGLPVPPGELLDLGEVRQSGGKSVRIWAVDGDLDPDSVTLGTFQMQWPPGSGRMQSFPELDRVAWLPLESARQRLVTAQRAFLDRLEASL
jgi:predicted NUDIX family NTP pyrophosphohydrolase